MPLYDRVQSSHRGQAFSPLPSLHFIKGCLNDETDRRMNPLTGRSCPDSNANARNLSFSVGVKV